MKQQSQNILKNYLLEKFLETRLLFMKDKSQQTDFLDQLKKVRKILVILPIDKDEEQIARSYLPAIQDVFTKSQISSLDLSTLRREDTNWLGVPNHHYLNNMQIENFNLLIDLNSRHDRLCAYLGALAGAELRLHAAEGKFDKIYNLHIRSPIGATLQAKYENIIHYLKRMCN